MAVGMGLHSAQAADGPSDRLTRGEADPTKGLTGSSGNRTNQQPPRQAGIVTPLTVR
jgi:hypothetical protein